MSTKDSRPWLVVGVLFVSWFLVWGGGLNTTALFFPPLLEHFGFSRAKLSSGFAVAALTGGLVGPIVGWLLDRVDAGKVMVVGVAVTAIGYFGLSLMQSFEHLVLCTLLLGIGFCACTGIPTALVVANWFQARRGLAMGIALSGQFVGGAVMVVVVNQVITTRGWRFAYAAIGLSMAVIVIPLLLAFVRSRPVSATAPHPDAPASTPVDLPGLTTGEAVAARSLWLITAMQFLGASVGAGVGQHFVAYLTGIGYTAGFAARMISIVFIGNIVGSLLSGPLADRITARRALVGTWILGLLSMVALLGARDVASLGVHVALAGFVGGATWVLPPLLMLESVGIKNYGSLMGLSGVFGTLGFAAGPIATGRIYDVTGSYAVALWIFVAAELACAIAALACRPYEREQRRTARTPA